MIWPVFYQMDAVDASGLVIPVSVWLKNLDGERSVVVMEPVERNTATFTFDCNVSSNVFLASLVYLTGCPTAHVA